MCVCRFLRGPLMVFGCARYPSTAMALKRADWVALTQLAGKPLATTGQLVLYCGVVCRKPGDVVMPVTMQIALLVMEVAQILLEHTLRRVEAGLELYVRRPDR